MNTVVKTSVVLFGVIEEDSNNYRKLSRKCLSVLLVKNDGFYTLPYYACKESVDVEEQSIKAINDSTGLHDLYVEQLYTFSNVNNDCLYINPTYLGLISKEKMYDGLKENCYWSKLEIEENSDGYKCVVTNELESFSFRVSKKLKEQTTDRYKFNEVDNGLLVNDVSVVLIAAFERLKNKAFYTDIVFNMMGEKFTLKELQNVYEAIENKQLLDAAFRRIIKDKVEETDEYLKGIGCRPSKLFKYKEK